ncbi:hypothetical protein [Streptomyces flaveus]|jgi:hypothetical protein|uniref:hypothetical protein n=1 Tax=Streptomyces flaveus TaxID=66370 RepID=UPI00332DF042
MTAECETGGRGATHIWVPFRDTSLYVEFADETGETARTSDPRSLLAHAVPEDALTRDDRYGAPMWRIDVQRLHAVVEALWNEDDRQVRIHLDQAPRLDGDSGMPGHGDAGTPGPRDG